MTNLTDIARSVLDKNWKTVLDLAQHLLSVGKMSGQELTAFLNERMAAVAVESQAV